MSRSAAVSISVLVGAIVLIVAAALLIVRPWEPSTAAPAPAAASGPPAELVDDTTHILDDECPACGQFHPIVEELRSTYAGEVTFAVRYFPLPSHDAAIPAALAAEAAAQQGQFEAMHELLFDRQQEWAGTEDAAAVFRGYAEELGLDLEAYDAAVADPATLDRVALDANAGISLGVQSTPTFFVDGEQLELRDFADLETAIQAALEQ